MKFAISTGNSGVVVIKVTEGNSIVVTNICYGRGQIRSVINIDVTSIGLCSQEGLEIHNKKYKKK